MSWGFGPGQVRIGCTKLLHCSALGPSPSSYQYDYLQRNGGELNAGRREHVDDDDACVVVEAEVPQHRAH